MAEYNQKYSIRTEGRDRLVTIKSKQEQAVIGIRDVKVHTVKTGVSGAVLMVFFYKVK